MKGAVTPSTASKVPEEMGLSELKESLMLLATEQKH